MSRNVWKRIGATLLLIISFIYAPFIVTLAFFVIFLFIFDLYIEGILLFVMADFTFAVPLERFHGSEILLTSIALIFFLLSLIVKPYLIR